VSDEYLWDRTGPADPEVERLERLLGRLRTTPPVPAWPERGQASRRMSIAFLAAAAVLVLASAASLRLTSGTGRDTWAVVRVSGQPTVGAETLGDAGRLAVGQWLTTDAGSSASLAVGTIGRLDVDPETRLRLLSTRGGDQRLALVRGTVHAVIWAPPGQFVVETPASTAVDLGCAYTLTIRPDGGGLIEVTLGWVGFEFAGREAFIPAGARCATRPGVGPGTPYYADAPRSFVQALAVIDGPGGSDADRSAALDAILSCARPEDAVTLWHLLSRIPAADRDRVFDALARLVPPPPSVTRAGVRRGDRAMLDSWWDSLGLGTSDWWRVWERRWR
jgi:hypothetical protein